MRPALSSRCALAGTLSLLLLAVAFGGCGTQGNAPPLTKPVSATLSGVTSPSGNGMRATVLLTPVDALHVTAYYRGVKIPTFGAHTPAELRQNSCAGEVVAPIAFTNSAGAVAAAASYSPDRSGGMDILLAPSSNLYVVVHAHQGESGIDYLVCGAPLSGENQYFDLYPPQTGDSGIALGTALMTPIVATRLSFTSTQDSFAPEAWAVHTSSCTGAVLAGGQFEAKTAHPQGVIYSGLGTHTWWITLTEAGGDTLCGPVGG